MQVSKQVVIGAVAAMVVMVGAIAFLLGRESGRHHAVVPAPVADYVPPPPPGAIPQLTGAAPYTMPSTPRPIAVATDPLVPPMPEAPPPPHRKPAQAPVAAPDEAAQVHEYFLKMTEIQTGPSSDPGEVANKLIAAQLNGDSSGFDSLVQGAQQMLTAAKAVVPPAPCVAYHAKAIELLGNSVTMLTALGPAIKKGDMGTLNAIVPQATALQSQATALESQAREIKARYN